MPERRIVLEQAHYEGRKHQGRAEVEAHGPDKIVLAVSSEQGYAPGARGYSHGGVVALDPAEARDLAAVLLAAADEAEALPEDYDRAKEALKALMPDRGIE